MWRGPDAVGQQALVSEAVRGEGAVLYDGAGRRVMVGVHPQEDLAPRDVVAAAISRRMAEAPGGIDDHVFLDATNLGQRFYERFPSITAACREIGIDPARERIPVAPAAHYACGGVPARLDGTTALAGLYAVGEVACTGVHGANRLASNSLTESVVAGTRLGRDLAWELPERVAGELALGAEVGTAIVDGAHGGGPQHDVPQRRRAARRGIAPRLPATRSKPLPARPIPQARRLVRRGRRRTSSPSRPPSSPPPPDGRRAGGAIGGPTSPSTRRVAAGTSTYGSTAMAALRTT